MTVLRTRCASDNGFKRALIMREDIPTTKMYSRRELGCAAAIRRVSIDKTVSLLHARLSRDPSCDPPPVSLICSHAYAMHMRAYRLRTQTKTKLRIGRSPGINVRAESSRERGEGRERCRCGGRPETTAATDCGSGIVDIGTHDIHARCYRSEKLENGCAN